MSDPIDKLASAIAAGLQQKDHRWAESIGALFGTVFHKRHWDAAEGTKASILRDAYSLAADDSKTKVPYAGVVSPESPPSGAYGGMSVAWFPTAEGSLISFVIGTRGLSPDEGILTRPGHHRKIAALRRYLASKGVPCWSKPDPAAINVTVPASVRRQFPGFDHVLDRYGQVLYCLAQVPADPGEARKVVAVFLHLYAYERQWGVLAKAQDEHSTLIDHLRQSVFETPDADAVYELLRERRFVVLQGPPGTGKTRLARAVLDRHFEGRGQVVQFHPSVTYEDFVVGLSPHTDGKDLNFRVRPGWLIDAAKSAADQPTLLIIDEINRADLGKVLGESIYLFEPGEPDRSVQLPHPVNGKTSFALPPNLYVLGTLNTADRSIASMDLAIRRRFAFMTMMPDRRPIENQDLPMALEAFRRVADVFIEHAPDDVLSLMPGHSYFLANSEAELRRRFRYELLPLLDEYLHDGLLGPATNELHSERDWLSDQVR